MSNVQNQVACQNATVLANVAALASSLIISLDGKNVSRTLNQESLTRDRIEQLVLTKLTASLNG